MEIKTHTQKHLKRDRKNCVLGWQIHGYAYIRRDVQNGAQSMRQQGWGNGTEAVGIISHQMQLIPISLCVCGGVVVCVRACMRACMHV